MITTGAPRAASPRYAPFRAALTPTTIPPYVLAGKPWLLTGISQFRPLPPVSLASPAWARDYNETKALGRRAASYALEGFLKPLH